jgi:[acyl-carrier-protein] S-malonyltransferase
MKTALIFPGQGIQRVGMGKDLYEEYQAAKNLYDDADKLLGFSIKEISFYGPEEVLTESQNAQVAITLNSYAIFSIIKEKLEFSCVAGHSLGEYTAHLVAGTFSFPDVLHLVRFRGELMSKAKKGKMSAIIGLSSEKILKIVDATEGVVNAANFNMPTQTVITGEAAAVKKAEEKLKVEGAVVIPLKVSGAFHSPLMREVTLPFKKVLSKTEIKKPLVPVYSNVTGEQVTESDEISETLGSQIEKPVQWVKTLQNMKKDGVERFIEIGHKSILTKMVKKTLDKVETMSISYPKDLKGILNGQ